MQASIGDCLRSKVTVTIQPDYIAKLHREDRCTALRNIAAIVRRVAIDDATELYIQAVSLFDRYVSQLAPTEISVPVLCATIGASVAIARKVLYPEAVNATPMSDLASLSNSTTVAVVGAEASMVRLRRP